MITANIGLGGKARALAMAVMAVLLCALVACGRQANTAQPDGSARQSSETDSQQALSDTEIINSAVDNFMLLAEVSRPSHHEEMISAFSRKS